jgi:ribosomal protein S14
MKLFFKRTDSFHRIHFKNKEYILLFRKLLLRSGISRFYKKLRVIKASYFRVRVNNSCILTGRAHAVYKGFKVSRFILKGMGTTGYLPGIRKCSW